MSLRQLGLTRPAVLLAGALIVGAGARLYHLGERSISHPEFHVPGIAFPEYVTHPTQRLTATEVLEAPLVIHHPHLPGYELLMLAWTKVAGTDLFVMRLTSALSGVFVLGAVYAFARSAAGSSVALLSIWLLALHGRHVFWSQQARPWVFVSLLGVTSAFLMYRLMQRWNPVTAVGYAAVATIGLWAEFYFWPIFAAQILWVLLSHTRRDELSPLLGVQLLAVILAMPAMIYFYRFIGQYDPVSGVIWPNILYMMQFGGLLRTEWFDGQIIPTQISLAIGVIGALAIGAGVRRSYPARTDSGTVSERPVNRGVITIVLLSACILSSVLVEAAFSGMIGHRRLFVATTAAPFVLVGGFTVARRTYSTWSRLLGAAGKLPLLRHLALDFPSAQALIPFLILLVIHLKKPVLVSYALVALVPFYVVLVSRGLLSGGRRVRAIAVGALLIVSAYSVYDFSTATGDPQGYEALAESLEPQLQDRDIVLVENQWWTVPIHYYFPSSRYTVIPPAALASMCEPAGGEEVSPPERVWALNFGPGSLGRQRIDAMIEKLPDGYQECATVVGEGGDGAAVLLTYPRAAE